MENQTETIDIRRNKSSKAKRIILAISVFLILFTGNVIFYVFFVSLMMWDSHNFNNGLAETLRCGSMPFWVPYYLIIFWPLVMLVNSIVPAIMILKRVNPFIWIVLIFAGIFVSFVVLTGWFGFIEYYCSGK